VDLIDYIVVIFCFVLVGNNQRVLNRKLNAIRDAVGATDPEPGPASPE
jgi:hypothetical protein